MQVFLETIEFNHDPDSANCDAFNIRQNETEFVAVPAWRRKETSTPAQSKAAYAIKELGKNVITIKAKFHCDDPTVERVEVRAINPPENEPTIQFLETDRATGSTALPPPPIRDDVLGWIPPQTISFSEDGEILGLKDSRIAQAGVGVHVLHWKWQFRQDSKDSWKTFEKTCHQIYTVLRVPKRPWRQRPYAENNTQLPWTDVLDYACSWANHAKDPDSAATKITQCVRDLEKKFYITYDPSPFYSDPNFDCTAFLDLIKGGVGKGSRLNCSDCATVVSTYANILGCALWQSTMDGTGSWNTFLTNPIRLFGRTCWREARFVIHEVAWKGKCSERDSLFDAALELDGDDHPARPPQNPLLPRNLRFGGLRDRQYLFRLLSPTYPGTIQPAPKTRCRRPIRPNPGAGSKLLSPKTLELIKSHYEFDKWPKAALSGTLSILSITDLIKSYSLTGKNSLGWNILVGPHIIKTSNHPPTLQLLLSPRTQQTVRLDVDFCTSPNKARESLLQRLGQFETPTLERREDLAIGEIAFLEPEVGATLFVRANLVVLVRNSGQTMVDSVEFAHELDLLFRGLLAERQA